MSDREIMLAEYAQLKEEQRARIGFRDNLIYAMLVAAGVSLGIGADGAQKRAVLLLLPAACFALGWTYLVNDEKISSIGRYVRLTLADAVSSGRGDCFGWEVFHRNDARRISRKRVQFAVDALVFVLPGILALAYFLWTTTGPHGWPTWLVVGVDTGLLVFLSAQLFIYADFAKGR